MKKAGSRRGPGNDTGLGSAVLDAPEERRARNSVGSYAQETGTRTPWQGRGPAPAGALQRGYRSDDRGNDSSSEYGGEYDGGYGMPDEAGAGDGREYVSRRGSFWYRFLKLPRSLGGRILLGVATLAILGTAAAAVAGARYYVLHDTRFVVGTSDDIQISGAPHLTRDQVLNVFAGDLERNIFRMPLAERQSDLEQMPWVKNATVMRLLPNQIRVRITERTPVAFARQGTQIGLVDASGVLLDMPPDVAGDPHYSFPVLTGLSPADPLSTREARMEIYEQFMHDLDSTGEHLSGSVSEVDLSEPEDVKAVIVSDGSDILVHFGQKEYLKRYREFEQHLPEWKLTYPKLASADMRYEGQVVLDMQDGAGAGDGGGVAPAVVETATAEANTGSGRRGPQSAQNDGKKQTVANTNVNVAKTKPAAKSPRSAKRAGVAKNTRADQNAINQREFAALAAAHRAALAKAASGGAAGHKAVKIGGASRLGGANQ